MMRLTPQAFWSLSLAEWRALQPRAAPALTRTEFDQLMQHHPDEQDAR